MNTHSILDSLKSLVIEETPNTAVLQPATTAAPPATPVFSSVPQSAAPISSFVGVMPPAPETDDFYQKLVAKTDFEQTDVAITLHKFLDPLANLPLDSALKFKTAVAQAKSNGGLTEDAILGVFDLLKATLRHAEESFNTKSQAFEDKEVQSRRARLVEIQSQVAALQTEQAQLSTDLSVAQAKSASTRAGFTSALQRRSSDIDQQKLQYAAMLK